MALGGRVGWDKSESMYYGVETGFEDDVPRLLSFNLSSVGFDFVVAPLLHLSSHHLFTLMDPTYGPSLMEVDNNYSNALPFAGPDLVLSLAGLAGVGKTVDTSAIADGESLDQSRVIVEKIGSWIDLDSEDEILRMDSGTTLKQEIA